MPCSKGLASRLMTRLREQSATITPVCLTVISQWIRYPTHSALLILDHEGLESAERIVDNNRLQLFSYYLEAAINKAEQRNPNRLDKGAYRH